MFSAMVWLTAQAADPSPAAEIRDAVVVVQQGSSTCAGVALSDGRIATAYHCVASGFGARVTTRRGVRFEARVQGTDPGHDLAVLTLRGTDRPSDRLAVNPDPVEVGDAIVLVGHPYAGAPPAGFLAGTLRWSVGSGTVAAVGERSLQVDVTVGPGHSGGPVVDASGRIVGIMSRRIGPRVGFAARAEALVTLLDAPRKPVVGGTIRASPAVWGTERPVVGLDLEVTWRERLVLSTQLGLPLSPVLQTVVRDRVEAPVALGRLGGRQPLGTGPGAVAFDAFVAVGLTRTWAGRPEGGLPEVSGRVDAFVGGGLGRGGFRLDVARRVTSPADRVGTWLFGLRSGLGQLRRVF